MLTTKKLIDKNILLPARLVVKPEKTALIVLITMVPGTD